MSVNKIASRYAKSLIDLAVENNLLKEVYGDIELILNACENRDLIVFFKSPVINVDKKEKIFKSIFDQKIDKLTSRFVEILIHKGREPILPSICTSFIDQYKILNKIRTASLISASPMSEVEISIIRNKYQSWLNAGETLDLKQVIDPSIIGGYIFQMDGRQIDSTVKRNLDTMKSGLFDSSYTNLVNKS